jgi:hypothetical protein
MWRLDTRDVDRPLGEVVGALRVHRVFKGFEMGPRLNSA